MIIELIIGAIGGQILAKKFLFNSKPPVNITPKDLYNTKELSNWDKLSPYERWLVPQKVDKIKKKAIKAKQQGERLYRYDYSIYGTELSVINEILKQQGFHIQISWGSCYIDLNHSSYKDYNEKDSSSITSNCASGLKHALLRYRSSMGSR